jgi:hypothetical protein
LHQASTSIDDPAFIHIWNLLDVVSIFSDNGQPRSSALRNYTANILQNNANPALSSGSSKSFWIAKPSMVAAKSLTI